MLPRLMLLVAALAAVDHAAAQSANPSDRPTVVATGSGEVTRPPEFVRLAFSVRGEGSTATDALAALARQRSMIETGLQGLRDVKTLEITNTQISTEDVRAPNCSPAQPYRIAQHLSVGDCAIVGGIATMELEVKVSPATKAGDVASMASQLGGKSVGLRGSGFVDPSALQNEAARKAVADARRQGELVAQAAGGHLGQVLRIQDAAIPNYMTMMDAEAMGAPPPPPPPLPVPASPPHLAVALAFTPQPVTRTEHITVIFALEPGAESSSNTPPHPAAVIGGSGAKGENP